MARLGQTRAARQAGRRLEPPELPCRSRQAPESVRPTGDFPVAIACALRPYRRGLRRRRRASGCSSGVEHNLAKVGVEGSNPFARSKTPLNLNGLAGSGIRAFLLYGVRGAGGGAHPYPHHGLGAGGQLVAPHRNGERDGQALADQELADAPRALPVVRPFTRSVRICGHDCASRPVHCAAFFVCSRLKAEDFRPTSLQSKMPGCGAGQFRASI